MRRSIRDKDLSTPFLMRLSELTSRRERTLMELLDQMAFVHPWLTELANKVVAYEGGWAERRSSKGWSLMWTWRSSLKKGKIACIEVYLSKGSKRTGDFERVSLRAHEDRLSHMGDLIGRKAAKAFAKDLEQFLAAARRAVRWVNAFPDDDLGILAPKAKAVGLHRWIEAISEVCEKRSVKATTAVERFLQLDDELNHLVFEFNEARQPVRFRSIICRRECPVLDPLAPAEPLYRVVEFFDRKTGRRSSRDVSGYKSRLKQQKLRERLRLQLGRDPRPDEMVAEGQNRTARRASPWLTEDIISHCHLGKHSGSINDHQKRMVATLEVWLLSRAAVRSLL